MDFLPYFPSAGMPGMGHQACQFGWTPTGGDNDRPLIFQKSSWRNILISLACRMSCLYPGPEIQAWDTTQILFFLTKTYLTKLIFRIKIYKNSHAVLGESSLSLMGPNKALPTSSSLSWQNLQELQIKYFLNSSTQKPGEADLLENWLQD